MPVNNTVRVLARNFSGAAFDLGPPARLSPYRS